MSNISGLAQLTSGVTALSNLIMVNPQDTIGYQPQATGSTSPQAPALLFQYEEENSVSLAADVTDHYAEDNRALHNQITIRPVTITVRGFVGELTDAPANKILAALKLVADKLTVIDAYTPGLSATAIIAYNEATLAYQVGVNALAAAVSAADYISGRGTGQAVIDGNSITNEGRLNQSKQEKAYQQFFGYMQNRTLFTVQTPWAIFQNCAITSLRAVQSGESRMISDFEVQFKQLRFASTVYLGTSDLANVDNQGQAASQSSSEVNLGVKSPSAYYPTPFS